MLGDDAEAAADGDTESPQQKAPLQQQQQQQRRPGAVLVDQELLVSGLLSCGWLHGGINGTRVRGMSNE